MSTNTSDTQGHRDNGQWDTVVKTPGDNLPADLDDEMYNADGTFHYPVKARSAQQAIAFWSKVEVDDEALTELQQTHQNNYYAWVNAQDEEWTGNWDAAYDAANPKPASKMLGSNEKALAEWDATKSAAFDGEHHEYLASIVDARMQTIGNSDVRTVARVLGLGSYAGSMDSAEAEKCLDQKFPIARGEMTVRDIFSQFNLAEISPNDLKKGSAAKQLDEMRRLASEMGNNTAQMNDRMFNLIDEVKELRKDNLQIVHSAGIRPV